MMKVLVMNTITRTELATMLTCVSFYFIITELRLVIYDGAHFSDEETEILKV